MIRKVTKSDYETIARLLIKAFKNPLGMKNGIIIEHFKE